MNNIAVLVIALAGGLLLSRLVKLLHLPNVTGFLIAGLLIGPSCFNLINSGELKSVSLITTVALGFIAFSIGGEFKYDHLKQLGWQVLVITVSQAMVAVLGVMGVLGILHLVSPSSVSVPTVLLLGAIAAATAPAATLMVIRQYKSKGIVTDTLLPVVAMDDAVGLMIFSVCFALSKAFSGGGTPTVSDILFEPLREIGLSLAVGAVLGAAVGLAVRVFMSRGNRLTLICAAVLCGVWLSSIWKLSALLTCMMIGAVFTNMRKDSATILEGCERWTPPLFMLFFVISGAELDLSLLPSVGLVGVLYLISRSLGKYFGAFAGASIVHSDKNVRRYLGITLLPQAGVAIGMAQTVASEPELAGVAPQIVAVVLSATLIYELIGPVLTKNALTRAGEIERAPKKTPDSVETAGA